MQEALKALTNAAKDSSKGNLLDLSINAARLRCTVGEISDALELAWGRYVPNMTVAKGAYRQEYQEGGLEETISLVQRFAEREGRRPRILVAKMGQDGHDRGAKVIASGFADFGFDVDVGALFQTPKEVAQQAVDADVHIVGVSSQAAGHRTLVPELIRELKELGAKDVLVVVGGVIPEQDYEFLHKEGVAAIYGPGTQLPVAARDIIAQLEQQQQQQQKNK